MIKSIRHAWESACKAAGLTGKIPMIFVARPFGTWYGLEFQSAWRCG